MLEALKYDASAREIRLMRATEELGYHMTRTELQFFKQYFDERSIREILQYASPARMYRYYTNVLEEKETTETIWITWKLQHSADGT